MPVQADMVVVERSEVVYRGVIHDLTVGLLGDIVGVVNVSVAADVDGAAVEDIVGVLEKPVGVDGAVIADYAVVGKIVDALDT